jgi:outer membrane protein assembly factor BamD
MTYASNDRRFFRGRAVRLALGLAGALALPAAARADMLDSLNPMNWFSGDKYKTEIIKDTPADDLYNQGLARLKARDYPAASKSFEALEKQYPYSQWQRKGLLMTTFSQYQAGSYDEAIGSARRYIGLYPNAPDVDYATYLEAMSYYNQIPDVSRDQERAAKASALFSEIPELRICPGLPLQASGHARPARRQGDGGRAVLSQPA